MSAVDYLIRFNFYNVNTGETLQVDYQLFDNGFSHRWFRLFKRAVDQNYGIQENGIFYGAAANKEEECVARMTDTVNAINAYAQSNGLEEEVITLKPHMGMSQEFLNKMHDRFEKLRPHPGFQNPEVQKHLADLNTLIHRCEGFLSKGFKGCHVEVNFNKVEYEDFEEQDYHLFTPDKQFGYLYLTYGVTGVPVEAAFYARPENPPLPQPNYCSGCFLYFNQSKKFDRWEELEAYLRDTWGWDIRDPKLAIGYIPLGKMVNPPQDQQAFVDKLIEHRVIRSIEFIPLSEGNQEEKRQTAGPKPSSPRLFSWLKNLFQPKKKSIKVR